MIRSEPALGVIRDDCFRLWCMYVDRDGMDVFYGLFRRLPTPPLLFRRLSSVVDFDRWPIENCSLGFKHHNDTRFGCAPFAAFTVIKCLSALKKQ